MVCYAIPTAAAILHYSLRKVKKNNEKQQSWLSLLFLGGAIFGFIDHLWNGELFASPNLVADLLLGTMITLGIFASWFLLSILERFKHAEESTA